ncbi:MAG: hypothetical protein ACK5LO_06980 [Leucobacter sp.]
MLLTSQRVRGARRKTLGLVTAVAVALGFVAVGPAAAQAAAFDQSISGTVSFKADKKFKIGAKYGELEVLTSKCQYVSPQDYKLSWSGKKYTVKFKNPGSYKIAYSPYNGSSKAPFHFSDQKYAGSKAADCAKVKAIKVAADQRVTKRNIDLVANGAVQVNGAGLKTKEHIAFYDSRTLKPVQSRQEFGAGGHILAPGKYKVAKVRVKGSGSTSTLTVRQVFGAGKSKSLKKGASVTVKAAKGLKLNWPKGKIASSRVFASSASVTLSGEPFVGTVGKKITAKITGFPKGTKFKYRWDGAASKHSSYTPKLSDAGSMLILRVTASHPDYLTKAFQREKYINPMQLKQQAAQKVNGSTASSLTVQEGEELRVTKATFDKSTSAVYQWYVDGASASSGSGSSFTPPAGAQQVRLETSYWRTGYETERRTVNITIEPAAPEEPPAPDADPQETVPDGDGTGGDVPDGEAPGTSDPSEPPSTEQPGAEPDADQSGAEEPGAEQPGAEQPGADQSGTGEPEGGTSGLPETLSTVT